MLVGEWGLEDREKRRKTNAPRALAWANRVALVARRRIAELRAVRAAPTTCRRRRAGG